MDAKSKANFINSVAGGQGIPCPNCSTLNEADSKFCIACGTPLTQKKPENAVPFATAEPGQEPVRPKPVPEKPKQAEQPKSAEPTVKYTEPESVFAEGLPSWDIEPPQVVVRRKRR